MNDCIESKRVVVLVDMDCFYCQVEVHHNQSLSGKPVAVVQYNSWKGGGIIAVNYEARAKGVNRHMRGDDAIKKCPDLNLVRVKELHGKADLSKYRAASQKVFEVLSEFSSCVQRASIDEAYVDLTSVVNDYISSNHNVITENDLQNTFVEGYTDKNSKIGAMMVEKLRESIFKKTGFHCSAGIANNKILAKLVCGLHKPNQQTLLPPSNVPHLFETIQIKKVKNLGGKLGNRVREEFNCEFMSDLAAIPLNDLQQKFDNKTSNFLYQISKGIDNEPVESRIIPKSIGSCKSFPLGLKVKEEIQHWLSILMNDIVEKLEADYETNKRKATSMTISVRYLNKETNLPTSQCGEVTTYNNRKLLDLAYSLLSNMTENQKSSNWKTPLSFLGISINKFIKITVKSSINNYFSKGVANNKINLCVQSGILENEKINSEINNTSESDSCTLLELIHTNDQKSSTKKCTLISTEQLSSLDNSNTKKNDTSKGEMKNIKTMFAQMRNSSNCSINYIAPTENVDNKIENMKKNNNQLNMNSFFSKKLKIISPTKNQLNDQVSAKVLSASTSSLNLSKKLEVISPSKNIPNNDKVKPSNQSPDGFFSKKLEFVSPSKYQNTNHDLELTIESPIIECCDDSVPTMLFCERCNNMIHINEYEEHIDHHVAMELSKSLNKTDIIQSTSKDKHKTIKNNDGSKKRKNNSKSFPQQKKPCSDISLFFKPVLNP
ncbi:DNA polymerase eta-like isoform X2 [Sipha flava]|uniref:DNA polymerase eta n=1 Tax=Sipha flava TaxID=143950 RepID=A0A2S2QCQ8_9HEMI|nr:DNA polymerase eta-like isoform X2 [Sipha flava]